MKKYITYRFTLFLSLVLSLVAQPLFSQKSSDELELAKKAFVSNAFDNSLKHLDQVLKHKPNSDEAMFYKGKCKVEMDLYNDALDNFTFASNLDPHEPEYYYYKGMCEWKLKRMHVAIQSLEKSLLYHPNNQLAFKVLGSIYYELNLPDAAKSYFDKILTNPAQFTAEKARKSKVEDDVEAYKTTLRMSNRETARNPKNAIAFLYKGLLKLIGKDNYGAYLDLNQSLEIDPDA